MMKNHLENEAGFGLSDGCGTSGISHVLAVVLVWAFFMHITALLITSQSFSAQNEEHFCSHY
jgi:hypothetical protein